MILVRFTNLKFLRWTRRETGRNFKFTALVLRVAVPGAYWRALLIAAACWLATSSARAEEICTFPAPTDISIEKELLITDLSVVNDARASGPGGPWSFAGLMTALAPGDATGLLKQWLDGFEQRQHVNGFPLLPRRAVRARIAVPWMRADGAMSITGWTPDLANAPFRLLAIVYRPDLGIVDKDGAIRSAGEARFVFTALDRGRTRTLDEAPPLPFTIIFEYRLEATDREAVKAWAEQWHKLGRLAFGADYNAALQAITDRFAGRDGKSRAALNQIRTNEGLARPWQLREFHLDAGRLVNAPLKDTPHHSLRGNARELSEVISTQPDHDLPKRFLSASADIPDRSFRWPQMRIANNVLRHNFALRTCNGCHGAETGRKADDHSAEGAQHRGFRHISGRMRNERARLSEFMTGDPTLVMDLAGKVHTFCDLKIRQQALHEALNPKPVAGEAAAGDLAVARKRRERAD
jgi:hypothetical protein